QVRAAAQHEHRQIFFFCPVNRIENRGLIRRIDEVTCRTANPESREGSELDVLVDECFHGGFSLTSRAMRRTVAAVYDRRRFPGCRTVGAHRAPLQLLLLLLVLLLPLQAQTPKRQPAPVMGVEGSPWLT